MECQDLLRCGLWMGLAVMGSAGRAQSLPAVPGGAAKLPPANISRVVNLLFGQEKALLGLPLGSSTMKAHCAVDGTAFFDLAGSEAAGQNLYGISPDGGVKHLLRKLPMDFTNVSVRDFFAGDRTLVTLLEAVKLDDGADASPPRETDYFVSLEDEAGDLSDLVQMQLRFRPVKIARFGSGDVIALGWDEGNLLPVLAFVKTDGTVHRFVDLDERRVDVTDATSEHKAEVAHTRDTLEMLQGAEFVAYGGEVMLTYPGTTKPVRIMSSSGELRTVPISIPAGYLLNDVLAPGSRWSVVVRVRQADGGKKAESNLDKPKMRLLEVETTHGGVIRELVLDKPAADEVTCAPSSMVTAMFYDALPNAIASSPSRDPATGTGTQLVVATARR